MTDYERVEKVILYLRLHYRDQPSLSELAKVAQCSGSHFHRLFSRWAGVTPKTFLKFLTLRHAKELLRQSETVLDTSFECGLSGPGRLHDLFVSMDGVTPGQFKTCGEAIEIRYGFHESPFGTCLIGITARGICHLAFVDSSDKSRALKVLYSSWERAKFTNHQQSTGQVLSSIFRGSRRRNNKIHAFLVGTPFQLKVWEAILRIPLGRILSYSDIACLIGQPRAARAVGGALASNPVAYLIPCHRVIRGTGVIDSYRWGSNRKQAILAWESAQPIESMKYNRG
jgi:AraC family transcriptional regulator, regulatory protein of adaptative response / methylated-DNA-[protein]-cysteine methyltransferase